MEKIWRVLLKMGCGCAEKAVEIQRYHEMIGSCDSMPSTMSGSQYSGLTAMVSEYSSNGELY